jgi:hypothetical protein
VVPEPREKLLRRLLTGFKTAKKIVKQISRKKIVSVFKRATLSRREREEEEIKFIMKASQMINEDDATYTRTSRGRSSRPPKSADGTIKGWQG